ncbi:MAG: QVPTGV class sortase B protein-sorting domain-containing protein [Eubacteriales bacterium]|nr:QVPTGV class sortase B protein-sorting domain-containing protein [Eubacteriales bacterium]
MAFGIVLSIVAIAGIIYGIKNKNKAFGIVSAIALILIIAVWIYFYNHPY